MILPSHLWCTAKCKAIGIYCISVNLTCNARSSNHLEVEVSIIEIRVLFAFVRPLKRSINTFFLKFMLTFYLRSLTFPEV